MCKEEKERPAPITITRREFLKEAGLAAGGTAIGSIAFLNACKGTPATSTEIPTQTTLPTETALTGTPAPTIVPPGTTAFVYVANRATLKLMPTPGCTSMVATDRLYSEYHIWVLPVTSDIVVLGITDKGQMLMERITALMLPKVGDSITNGEPFGYAEGDKIDIDLLSPVSGKMVQVNDALWSNSGDNAGFVRITSDPYINGWMVAIQMNNPEELKGLLTPEKYAAQNAK